jgi:hypothetical protein
MGPKMIMQNITTQAEKGSSGHRFFPLKENLNTSKITVRGGDAY